MNKNYLSNLKKNDLDYDIKNDKQNLSNNKEQYSDIFETIMFKDFDAFKYFYNQQDNPLTLYSSEDKEERASLLCLSVIEGSKDIFDFLIEKGANIKEISGNDGQNLLQDAAFSGNLEIFKDLVNLGIDTKHKDNNGNNVLHYAAFGSNTNIAKYIIENIDINMLTEENKQGRIPLECTSKNNKAKSKEFKDAFNTITNDKVKEKLINEVDIICNNPYETKSKNRLKP